jgi:hypothetical protein
MADVVDGHLFGIFIYAIDHSVVADADAMKAFCAGEFDRVPDTRLSRNESMRLINRVMVLRGSERRSFSTEGL